MTDFADLIPAPTGRFENPLVGAPGRVRTVPSDLGSVAALTRYPVKSLAGEALPNVMRKVLAHALERIPSRDAH